MNTNNNNSLVDLVRGQIQFCTIVTQSKGRARGDENRE